MNNKLDISFKHVLMSFILLISYLNLSADDLFVNENNLYQQDPLTKYRIVASFNGYSLHIMDGWQNYPTSGTFTFDAVTKTIIVHTEEGDVIDYKFDRYSYINIGSKTEYIFPIEDSDFFIAIQLHIDMYDTFIRIHCQDAEDGYRGYFYYTIHDIEPYDILTRWWEK